MKYSLNLVNLPEDDLEYLIGRYINEIKHGHFEFELIFLRLLNEKLRRNEI